MPMPTHTTIPTHATIPTHTTIPTHSAIPRPSPTDGLDVVLAGLRAELDALDDELVDLMRRRRDASREIQQLRVASGGPRIQHGRERVVLGRYRDALGPEGGRLALAILELCRGRA
ncbi:MAG: chorismate mutase [Frankiaceae bacterium]|nr:chorismate mutase [Frankiaceae bacterium]